LEILKEARAFGTQLAFGGGDIEIRRVAAIL
jgi:hypothetical protein